VGCRSSCLGAGDGADVHSENLKALRPWRRGRRLVDCATCGAALQNEYATCFATSAVGREGQRTRDQSSGAAGAKLKDVTVFIDEHKEWLPAMKPRPKLRSPTRSCTL